MIINKNYRIIKYNTYSLEFGINTATFKQFGQLKKYFF